MYMSNRIRYNNFAPRSCTIGRKATLQKQSSVVTNAVPLTKDRRPPQRHVLTIAGTSWLRLLYHHVADHVIVPLGEALVLRIPLGQHPLGIRLSLEKLRPNV